jgi:hypothetical protein
MKQAFARETFRASAARIGLLAAIAALWAGPQAHKAFNTAV